MVIEKSEANRAIGVNRNGDKCGSLYEFKLERNVATVGSEWRAAALSCLGAASSTLWLYSRLLARRPGRRLSSAIMARLPRLG
jgi:hypothetical protein